MTDSPKFRAGDVVRHRPSGKTCPIGAIRSDGGIGLSGWPEMWADAADCDLVKACSDKSHRATVREAILGGANYGYYSLGEAARLGLAEYVEVPCCSCGGTGKTREFKLKETK